MKRIALAAAVASLAATAHAATIDVNLSNDTIRAEYDAPLPQQRLNLSVGGMYHEENDNDATLVHAGLHTQEHTAQYSIGMGAKAYWLNSDNVDGIAVGLGGQGSYTFPQLPLVRFGGHLYIAPKVSSFSDLDGLMDLSVRAYYQALRDVDVYVGWRKLSVDVKDGGDSSLDKGVNIGFVMNF
ncbi:YfaZ family outer membrane protein [Oceanospirillum beijerinckii]|uniref:YfaZ family outer membrane protein n=1 Tax=Oceanospirillum beijerinckii TaxID=64976 RepID=UPI0004233BF1|nr:YfaZ family outer membrane protein [Oceanospirillum beijerinckii]